MRSHYTRIFILILEVWGFLRLRSGVSKFLRLFWGWRWCKSFKGIENLSSKTLTFWGENEGKTFEVFWGILENPWKMKQKSFENSLKIRDFWGSSKILENFEARMRVVFSRIFPTLVSDCNYVWFHFNINKITFLVHSKHV